MAVPSFLFGGSTNETPASIKQKRDLVRALMGASNAPRNIGEGLNALGDGIVANVLDRRANEAEAKGTTAANDLFNSILGTGAPATSAPTVSMPSTTGAGQQMADTSPTPAGGMGGYRNAIASIESAGSGDYGAVGPTHPKLGRALGRYQIMEANIGPWSQEALGRAVTPDEFMADPKLQDAIFDKKFGGYVEKFGPEGAAQAWIGGPGGVGKLDRKDSLGTSIGAYGQKFNRAIGANPQVASAATPQAAIEAAAPASGYVDPMVSTPNSMAAQPAATQVPPLDPPRTIAPAPQVAQVAQPQQRPAQAPQAGIFGGVDPRLLQALQNPFLNEGQKASIQLLIQQQQRASQQQQEQQTWQAREEYKRTAEHSDPSYQLEQDYKKAQLEALKNKTGKTNLINAGEGNIYDPDSKTWIKAPGAQGQTGDAFRFGGNSVEAQALNGLIESQQLTPMQAQSLAAGKTITGPNGEILFLTPQGVFKQPGGQAQAQPSPEVDIFAGTPMEAGAQAAPQQQTRAPTNDAIPITSPKAPSNEQLNAASFADRMNSAGQKLDQYEGQGLNGTSQFLTRSPFVPSIIGNTIVGKTNPEYQVFDQAKRDFINAQLRRESGAVIGQDEFDNADKQYFPQPGDSPEVIKQKREARKLAVESMGRSAGPTYKRPAAESDDIRMAREAIAKGADRQKVIQRLRDANIDPTGL